MANSKPVTAPSDDRAAAIASAVRTLDLEVEGLRALATALRDGLGGPFNAAIDLIRKASGRVIVTGMGKSGHIARKIAATLASTGTPAFFIHAGDAGHGDLGMVTEKDVVLALSWSGETAELKTMIDYAKRSKVALVGITSGAASTLGKAADVALVLPDAREACPHNLAPTTSAIMQLALGDALAIALLEGRGFTASQFSNFHPAGKLGAMLKFARDLMHSGDAIPLKPAGTKMADAVVEMSAKGFGCVGIVDSHGMLAGIITDGDLRRHMKPNLLDAKVEDVMTKSPKVARPDQLATEVLEMMNTSKITTLFIAEGRKPVGLLHMHDLLRAGVA